MDGAVEGFFPFDLVGMDEGSQTIFECEGTLLFGEGDFLMQVLQRVSADMVTGAIGDHEEFGGGHASTALAGEEDLGVDGGEGHGKFLANGGLAFDGK